MAGRRVSARRAATASGCAALPVAGMILRRGVLCVVALFAAGGFTISGAAASAAARVTLVCQQAEGPAQGATANCSVSVTGGVAATTAQQQRAAAEQWIKIERTDGRADGRRFPMWVARSWGWQNIAVQFMGAGHGGAASDPHGSVPLVASRWSARWNGTQTADTSAVARIKYDWRGFQAQRFGIDVRALRPGLVELSATSLNASLPASDHYTFWQFWVRLPGNATLGQAATFTSKDLNTMVQSVNGSIRIAFAAPGTYYWGVSGELQGLHGHSSANGTQCGLENYWDEIGYCAPGSPACPDCLPFTTPLALKVVGPTGETGNASLPAGFSGGTPVLLPSLARPHQLCIVTTDVTIFSGSRLAMPLCPPIPASTVNRLSVRAPTWMAISTVSGRTENFVQSNKTKGLVTTTFEVDLAKIKVYGMLPLFFRFDETHAGGTFTLDLALHEANVSPRTWQQLITRTVVLPASPTTIDTRLVGSITWAESHPVAAVGGCQELLLESTDAGGADQNLSFIETYARAGFNVVPQIFTEYFVPPAQDRFGTPPPLLYPANRTGAMWSHGLKFGPMHEGFKQFFSLPKQLNASLLPHWVPPSQTQTELLKWGRALNYSHGKWPTVLDLAYDGSFFVDDVNTFCAAMEIMQPDIVFVDDEGWGGGWHSWWVEGGVNRSANAQARRLPNESDLGLAVRMVMELFERWTSCLRTVSPHTRVAHYGSHPFPDLMMRAGILQQIGYDQVFFPSSWTSEVRRQRQLSNTMPTPLLFSKKYFAPAANQLREVAEPKQGKSAAVDTLTCTPMVARARIRPTLLVLK